MFIKTNIPFSKMSLVYTMPKYLRPGIAHFCEHIIGNRFLRHWDTFQRNNVVFCPFTCPEYVSFQISGLKFQMKEVSKILLDTLLSNDLPTVEEFEKEKKIILAEVDGSPMRKICILDALERFYSEKPNAGRRKDVEGIEYDEVINVLQTFFEKPSLSVVDGEEDLPENRFDNPTVYRQEIFPAVVEDRMKLHPFETFFFPKEPSANDEDLTKQKLVMACLVDGLRAPLYDEIRTKRGLCYSISSDTYKNQDVILFYSIKSKSKDAIELMKEILYRPENYITRERWNVINDRRKVLQKCCELAPQTLHRHFLRERLGFVVELLDANYSYEEIIEEAKTMAENGYYTYMG